MTTHKIAASFRDPSGFLFWDEGVLYRQVNQSYQTDYDLLMSSGLYQQLVDENLLIRHEESDHQSFEGQACYKVIQPDVVPFISYPYEWCFSQLKDAALATLAIQKKALDKGLSLKDASAYNIQFYQGKPILIDSLSFEAYPKGKPWVAYKQFCQHFLAPLALMALKDIRLSKLLANHIDGIPLDLASSLLPLKSKLNLGLASHIHMHAKAQQRFADKAEPTKPREFSLNALKGMLDNLESTVKGLKWKPAGTEWGDYYQDTNYTDASLETKKQLVTNLIQKTNPHRLLDIGANTGFFSRAGSVSDSFILSTDIDEAAVEKNYREVKKNNEHHLHPLILNLTNPSPAIGWANTERDNFFTRARADTIMALALIHHLAISNNVPLADIAQLLSQNCTYLIIEFVPKQDSQVKRLLATREDIFSDYDIPGFEESFKQFFTIEESIPIQDTHRTLYLMKKI